MKIDLDDKTDVLTYHKKLLAEAVKKELKIKLESFETSSKSLNTLLNSQLSANDKAGFGHNGAKESKEWESDSEDDEIVVKPKEVTKTVKPSFEKIESVNARNETVRQAENPRKNNKSHRGNKRNWNGMMTQKLGENFEFNNKACYVCGSFDHLHYTCKHKRKINDQKQVKPVWNNLKRVNHQNFGRFSHPNPKSNIVPQAVLTKSGIVSLNTAKLVSIVQSRKTMNDAMPITYSYYKAYSSVKRPFNKKTTNYNRYFNKRVNTVKSTRVNTARPKAEVNTVKASASWVWKPKHEELDHVFKSNSASKTLTRYDYVDALGSGFENCQATRDRRIFRCWFHFNTTYGYQFTMFYYEELAIPGQTTTGKESSNPFMAEFKNHLSDNEESLGEDASKQGRIDDADAEVTFIDETSNDARNKNNKISNNN
ncbi:hypothetical protein Tco_1517638 [Tanacetum coccineum]